MRLVGELLTLRLAFNSGAAFSVATGHTLLLSLFSIFVCGVILLKSLKFTSTPWVIGSSLIVGGIAGNLWDRILRPPHALKGEVVDWIHLSHWPTFNLADTSIVVGAALIAALTFRNIPANSGLSE